MWSLRYIKRHQELPPSALGERLSVDRLAVCRDPWPNRSAALLQPIAQCGSPHLTRPHASLKSWSGVTSRSTRCPLPISLTGSVRPMASEPRRQSTASGPDAGAPSRESRTSPERSPARAAGVLASTDCTMTAVRWVVNKRRTVTLSLRAAIRSYCCSNPHWGGVPIGADRDPGHSQNRYILSIG